MVGVLLISFLPRVCDTAADSNGVLTFESSPEKNEICQSSLAPRGAGKRARRGDCAKS